MEEGGGGGEKEDWAKEPSPFSGEEKKGKKNKKNKKKKGKGGGGKAHIEAGEMVGGSKGDPEPAWLKAGK